MKFISKTGSIYVFYFIFLPQVLGLQKLIQVDGFTKTTYIKWVSWYRKTGRHICGCFIINTKTILLIAIVIPWQFSSNENQSLFVLTVDDTMLVSCPLFPWIISLHHELMQHAQASSIQWQVGSRQIQNTLIIE